MPAILSPETRTLLRLIGDGQWHHRELVLARLAATIPPGKALRRYERREVDRAVREGPRKTAALSEQKKIASGQRTLANVAWNSLRQNYLEVRGDGVDREIRIRPDIVLPDVTDPGVLLGDDRAGDGDPSDDDDQDSDDAGEGGEERAQPHTCAQCLRYESIVAAMLASTPATPAPQPPTPAPAICHGLDESVVRGIVWDQMTTALDSFQYGLNLYLDEQFATVLARIRHLNGQPRRR